MREIGSYKVAETDYKAEDLAVRLSRSCGDKRRI